MQNSIRYNKCTRFETFNAQLNDDSRCQQLPISPFFFLHSENSSGGPWFSPLTLFFFYLPSCADRAIFSHRVLSQGLDETVVIWRFSPSYFNSHQRWPFSSWLNQCTICLLKQALMNNILKLIPIPMVW